MTCEHGSLTELTIDDLGSAGEAVGSFQGLRVFIEGALPGERVKARVIQRKKSYARAELEEILLASSQRVQPPCPVFGRCGGCQLQHLSYEAQLEAKRQRVQAAMLRIAGLSDLEVRPCVPSPAEYAYRNKIQLRVGVGPDKRCQLGLFAKRSHTLIHVDHCLIHCEIGESIYPVLKELVEESPLIPYDEHTGKGQLRTVLLRNAVNTAKVLVVFVNNGPASKVLKDLATELMRRCPLVKGVVCNINTRRDNVILGKNYQLLVGEDSITEELCGLQFKVSPASFFQVNSGQAAQLYDHVLSVAELSQDSTLLDAYCGVGTLALYAAKKAQQVIGVEVVPQAIEDAKANAQRNGITNARFLCGKVEELVTSLPPVDSIFLNPPRAGCDLAMLEGLVRLGAKRLVYVSCDPATLARDLKILGKLGYKILEVQPFDMFPQTMHVESVAVLSKSS